MPPKKPAIALGPIDDIVKAVVKQIITNKTVQSAAKKKAKTQLGIVARKNIKSSEKLEKAAAKSPTGTVRSTTRSRAKTQKQAAAYDKAWSRYDKYRGGR